VRDERCDGDNNEATDHAALYLNRPAP
jgi:hypothetical protein